ncbi:MAG: diguanylate cyclase [Gammaproteobacteria bacterium]|nr:diguanylate cyclase [Gammaproteobacteria bacterium]
MNKTAEDWKIKYFDSLSELEQKEKHWQSVESTLRRCISRLSLIGDGIDEALDLKLEQLRNRVRGEPDLRLLQQAIEEITSRAEKRGGVRSASSGSTAEKLLLELVSEVDFPKVLAKRAHQLTSVLKATTPNPEALHSAKNLLLEAMRQKGFTDQEQRKGLFGKLFAKDGVSADREGEADSNAEKSHHSELLQGKWLFLLLLDQLSQSQHQGLALGSLVARAESVVTQQELEKLAIELAQLLFPGKAHARYESLPTVEQVLMQLLEQLDLAAELQPRIHGLRKRLIKGLSQADIDPVLEEILQLVEYARACAEQERQAVEKFLLQMTEQLQKLDQEVNSIGDTGQRLIDGGRRMDREMQLQVNHLQNSVEHWADLDQIKITITERLNLIHARLRGQRDETEQLVQEFNQRIDQLSARIGEMEQERIKLHESVEKARSEAFTDALTGLQNRHAFDSRLQQEYLRWSRYGNPLSLIVVDVDYFKKVNDTYGHLAGDKVLSVIGNHLKQATRQVDFAARYGGEEFVVLLPEADLNAAMSVAEKIRRAVEEKPFHAGDNRVVITISCGVSTFREGDGRKTPFERADEALYLAKRTGRNRCCSEHQIELKNAGPDTMQA